MHPRITELLSYVAIQREALQSAAESVPRDQWNISPGNDRWSVCDVLEHLAIVEGRIAGLLTKQISEAKLAGLSGESDEMPQIERMGLERLLDRSVRLQSPPSGLPRNKPSPEAAWDALNQSRVALVTAVMSGDGYALGTLSFPHIYLGALSMYEWIAFVGAHDARHAAQIREIAEALA